MNFVAVAIVSVIVLGHLFNKSRLLISLNRVLLCLNNSSQITKISCRFSYFCFYKVKQGELMVRSLCQVGALTVINA